MDRRQGGELVGSGVSTPRSSTHHLYIALEVTKVLALIIVSITLLSN